ncbi:CHAT domain-containing protein [Enhygromyxa salina]|uniref:CHAT domain-containing protein n=1 Tax=Enhygromyxa salina TaxID=215803 RepID=UPI0011B245BF|nr:CHAT domain-containing protein [Enhygromyxa salina]
MIDWTSEDAPHVSGFLLAQTGRVDEAVARLTAACERATEFVRASCLNVLLPLLPNGPERRRHSEEFELLLDRYGDAAWRHNLAAVQADLAQAGRDLELMARALAHARRAAPELRGVGNGLIVDILSELIVLGSTQPTAALAELAEELAQPISEVELAMLAKARERAAFAATATGPLCPPRVLRAADQLAELAAPLATVRSELVRARCRWVVERQRGVQSDPGDWPEGNFDRAPQWMIDLTLGSERSVAPEELRIGHELLPHVVEARRDVADHLLVALIPAWEAASGDWVTAVETSISEAIETPIYADTNAWPELSAAVNDACTRSDRAWLHGVAATLARARGEAPPTNETATTSTSASENLRLLFNRARQASEYVRELRSNDCEQETEAARAAWCEALTAAEQVGDVLMIFHARVGIGNAARWGAKPDLEQALVHYRAASALGVERPKALAKLWKVWGDCLYERGDDDDLREAYQLIARSIDARTDRLRAESLLSAEQIAACHPDFDDETRLRRAVQHMTDAVRAGPELADAIVPQLCRRIAELRRYAPKDHGTDDLLNEIERRHAGHRPVIEQARGGVGQSADPEIVDYFKHMMSDPDGRIIVEVQHRMMDVEQSIAQMPAQMLQHLPVEQLRAQLEANSIRNHPERLRAELARLRGETAAQGATGRLVAQVLVLAQLVRLGQGDESEARQATAEARRVLRHANTPTRVLLGSQLAEAWQTHDQSNAQPMSDIDLSREIAAEAVEAGGGLDHAFSDAVVLLARGYRYARTGDRNEHLRRARDIYARLHARALAAGDGDTAAASLNHQVDAELEMAVGDRKTRLREGIEKLERARTLARMPIRIAEIEISIAWHLTQLADVVGGVEQRGLLEQAMARFDAVDRRAAPSTANLDHLRGICEGSLARVLHGPEAEAELLEAKLTDPSLSAYDRAIAQHNLAIRLRRMPQVDSVHLLRALVLFDEAAKVREPVSARHAWETCYEAGLMLVQALKSEQGLTPELLPWEATVAILQARSWLERALTAATQLGPGEELVDAAIMLGRLAFDVRTLRDATEIAKRSWDALRRAAPYLLFRDELRDWEAKFCRSIAVRLAALALEDGIVGVGGEVRAIHGDATALVIRWLLRAQASARRPTLARIQRPETATVAWWSTWQATLDRRDHRALAKQLEEIHGQEPNYLTGEPVLDETWAWLEAEPEAVAIAVLLERDTSIAAVLYFDDRGGQQTRVLVLPSRTPPGGEAELIALLKNAISGDPAALRVHELVVKWARESIATPVIEYLGRAPKTVLWCPGPILRLATPSSVWAGVPVACVHSLALPRHRRLKPRPRSSLIAAAMPTGERMAGMLEDKVKIMLDEAKHTGPARALVSAADVFGNGLRQLRPIRNTPASPEDLLAEAPNHDLVVVLAHGGAGSEEQAALGCVDADGNGALLTGKHLAAHHDAFAGATVVLLACSSGRIGGELHAPDGVAGALLAAGARAVIAPLWSVYLNIAVHAARALLRGFAEGQRAWEVVAQLPARMIEAGPALDEPSDDDKRAGGVVQLQSFVVWLG